jgi:endogenous inhibitor of DNA gyrase (YacG/DUF329 family)
MAEARAVCVNCRVRPVDAQWRPFCSERCKLLDLARWADGAYRVPGEAAGTAEDSEGAGDPRDTDNSEDQRQK